MSIKCEKSYSGPGVRTNRGAFTVYLAAAYSTFPEIYPIKFYPINQDIPLEMAYHF